MIKLYVCTFLLYSGDELDEVDSLMVTAIDEYEAENYLVDLFDLSYPDQEVDYKIKLVEHQVYSKIFLYENLMKSRIENLN